MKELLEQVAKAMPGGWVLKLPLSTDSYIQKAVPDTPWDTIFLKPEAGDIGLAPLTALLKQSFHEIRTERNRWANGPRIGEAYWNALYRSIGQDWQYENDHSTEFEAVARAYLSLKQAGGTP